MQRPPGSRMDGEVSRTLPPPEGLIRPSLLLCSSAKRKQAHNHPQQAHLAAARGPHQGQHLSGFAGAGDVVQHLH